MVAHVNPAAELTRTNLSMVPEAGQDVFQQDRMVTDSGGQVHLMLVDKSTFTVGPGSDITLDRFIYDPTTGSGDMALSAARGVMRFVGGELSKNAPVEIHTSIGVLGIRGGIILIEIPPEGGLRAIFGYGVELTFTNLLGQQTVSIVRPGYMIEVSPQGEPSAPFPAPENLVNSILTEFERPEPTDSDDAGESRVDETEQEVDPGLPTGSSDDPENTGTADDTTDTTEDSPQGGLPEEFDRTEFAQVLLDAGVASIEVLDGNVVLVDVGGDVLDTSDVLEDGFIETVTETAGVSLAEAVLFTFKIENTSANPGSFVISITNGSPGLTPTGPNYAINAFTEFVFETTGFGTLNIVNDQAGATASLRVKSDEFADGNMPNCGNAIEVQINSDGTATQGPGDGSGVTC